MRADEPDQDEIPLLQKIDVTRDIRGAFYALDDWKPLYDKLGKALEKWTGAKVRNNGNSFNSCFQYEALRKDKDLDVRFKFYYKSLMFLQSRSVQKTIGMNMKAFFQPPIRMG